MTTEEKIQILRDAEERAFAVLATWDGASMDTAEFGNLLDHISQLDWMAHALSLPEESLGTVAPPPRIPEPEPEKPVETVEPEKPKARISSGDLRASFAEARKRGVNVAEIIQSFGAANFNDLTEDQFPEVVEQLNQALEKVKS